MHNVLIYFFTMWTCTNVRWNSLSPQPVAEKKKAPQGLLNSQRNFHKNYILYICVWCFALLTSVPTVVILDKQKLLEYSVNIRLELTKPINVIKGV